MYAGVMRDWYADTVNFHRPQTRGWDALPWRQRKLLSRLDSREYTRLLEAELARVLGRSAVERLGSSNAYKAVDLEA